MPNVFDAAKYILEKAGPMDPYKLQKLLYYAQAWSLVWDEEELFPEEFEAWASGPVCRELYEWHKTLPGVIAQCDPRMCLECCEADLDICLHCSNTYADKGARSWN